jgi:4'-phosphopantetheinyl transferase
MNLPELQLAPSLEDWRSDKEAISLAAREIRSFCVDLGARGDDDDPEVLLEWAVLSESEHSRALRFVRPRDQRRFVLCRGALRVILGHLLDRAPRDIAFRTGPGGKPELDPTVDVTGAPLLRFNVTHSDDLAMIAVSRSREVGIDVERVRTILEAARIVESYFTRSELVQFSKLHESDRPAAFLRGWTRKEAILKVQGVGIAGLANAFETMFGTGLLSSHFTPTSPFHRIQRWSLWEARPRDGYVAALAAEA